MFTGSDSGASGSQVQALRTEVVQLRTELSQERLSKSDYAQLQRLLSLAGKGGYRIVAASVIANGQGFQQTVTLDAGSADGVKPRETVLNGQGLVGEVTSVGPRHLHGAAGHRLVLDRRRPLAPERPARLGDRAGQDAQRLGRMLSSQVLDASAVLRPGEQLVTSASVHDRPYVPGVPVGVITSSVSNRAGALTAAALVQPYVNFTALGVVGIVIEPPRHNPRFSVLPPMPHVKPTPDRHRDGDAAGQRVRRARRTARPRRRGAEHAPGHPVRGAAGRRARPPAHRASTGCACPAAACPTWCW